MSKNIIIDNDYATLWYHTDNKIVHHQFHKFIHGERFRGVLEKGLEIFKEHNATKWLSDDRKNSAIPKEDAEWAMVDWNPQVISAGWKYWAIVLPDKILGKTNMSQFIKQQSEQGVTVEIFDDADEALVWLKSVD